MYKLKKPRVCVRYAKSSVQKLLKLVVKKIIRYNERETGRCCQATEFTCLTEIKKKIVRRLKIHTNLLVILAKFDGLILNEFAE